MKLTIEGKYYEDWQVGDEFETGARTVTETDIVLFAGLSGDYNPLHTNEVFAKGTIFGTRVAHGFLVHSISIGLINQTKFFDGVVMAQKGHRNVMFTKGVIAGDTVCAHVKVAEKNDGGKADRGDVVFEVEMVNQRGEVCQKSTRVLMLKKRQAKKG